MPYLDSAPPRQSQWRNELPAGHHLGPGNPVTLTAAYLSSSSEKSPLHWTAAGTGVTGHEIRASSVVNESFAVEPTEPTGIGLTAAQSDSAQTGTTYFR